jgi:GNAT superfamily N-acetyltransferase/catechol 2,3-dioxygenase-like lactoylglutathione lyase family enzyme
MADEPDPVALCRSQAILAVADVPAAVRFYRDKLGFTGEWLWGDPPSFGGVSWGKVGIMFCLQPDLAARVEGHQHAFFVRGIDRLHELHRARGVEVVSPPEDKPWGLREYTVRDPNGYRLRFGEPVMTRASTAAKPLPPNVRLVERLPTLAEYEALVRAVGWVKYTNLEAAPAALENTRYCVVAVDADRAVGMARVVGDGGMAYFVQDVMVVPELQRRGIGTALMEAVTGYFRQATPRQSAIALFTGRNLAGFYERHGFEGPDTSLYGMYLKKWDGA